ncbi:MAG: hypothetical protein U1F43_36465 [Myxococcota bacterium]
MKLVLASLALAALLAAPALDGSSSAAPPSTPSSAATPAMPASASLSVATPAPTPPAPTPAHEYRAEWTRALTAARQRAFDRLAAYQAAGRFALNLERPGMWNVFADARGRLCAMADLIATSGHADLVADTALARNDVVLATVHDGPLYEWMLTSGLLQEEIAFVQGASDFIPRLQGLNAVVLVNPEVAETARFDRHLTHVRAVLKADDKAAVAAAVDRLGARLLTPPPSR